MRAPQHSYSSQGVMHKMIDRYQNQAVDDTEITGPNAYGHTEGGAANGAQPTANPVKLSTTKSGNKKRRRSSDDSDDDDDDEGEDDVEEAALTVKVEKSRSEGKAKGNGNQTVSAISPRICVAALTFRLSIERRSRSRATGFARRLPEWQYGKPANAP